MNNNKFKNSIFYAQGRSPFVHCTRVHVVKRQPQYSSLFFKRATVQVCTPKRLFLTLPLTFGA